MWLADVKSILKNNSKYFFQAVSQFIEPIHFYTFQYSALLVKCECYRIFCPFFNSIIIICKSRGTTKWTYILTKWHKHYSKIIFNHQRGQVPSRSPNLMRMIKFSLIRELVRILKHLETKAKFWFLSLPGGRLNNPCFVEYWL